ncbi:hypothetical protein [Halococcus hamelinensis]|uniref:hypothetical protein n=1 Tax=Halococcus hamelinensis TaxID=332168 RepID=UPI000AA7BAC9|nr:hypothetical protein [Halococcus hamelinensis]
MYDLVVKMSGGLVILGGLGLAGLVLLWPASFSHPATVLYWLLTLLVSIFVSGWIIGYGASLVFRRRRYTTYGICISVAGGLGAGLWIVAGHLI